MLNSMVPPSPPRPELPVAELQQIVDQIDSFLNDWVDRFDRASLQSLQDSTPDEALARQIRDFQQQRRCWDQQRRKQLADLDAQAQLLADAWLRLESEQRALLQSAPRMHP